MHTYFVVMQRGPPRSTRTDTLFPDPSPVRARNPAARGLLVDRPQGAAGAAAPIRDAGLEDRCRIVSGDFLDRVPAGGDLYLVKKVIHDWDDERARTILANCRAAIADGGSILVMAEVILPGNGPAFGTLLAPHMLAQTPGGRER